MTLLNLMNLDFNRGAFIKRMAYLYAHVTSEAEEYSDLEAVQKKAEELIKTATFKKEFKDKEGRDIVQYFRGSKEYPVPLVEQTKQQDFDTSGNQYCLIWPGEGFSILASKAKRRIVSDYGNWLYLESDAPIEVKKEKYEQEVAKQQEDIKKLRAFSEIIKRVGEGIIGINPLTSRVICRVQGVGEGRSCPIELFVRDDGDLSSIVSALLEPEVETWRVSSDLQQRVGLGQLPSKYDKHREIIFRGLRTFQKENHIKGYWNYDPSSEADQVCIQKIIKGEKITPADYYGDNWPTVLKQMQAGKGR